MTYALGIDVSRWQDDNSTPQMMDFEKSKTAGARFVFIKASQAAYLDSDYIKNWQHAKDAHLPVGGYHFMDWSKPVIEQARFFSGVLKADPGELPPVVDFECSTGAPAKAACTDALYSFINEVERIVGKQVMIYTGAPYWMAHWDGRYKDFFTARPLWFACYGTEAGRDIYLAKTPWKRWTFWQFTNKGDGLKFGAESKDLDMDYYNGTPTEFATAFGLAHVPTIEERLTRLEAAVFGEAG